LPVMKIVLCGAAWTVWLNPGRIHLSGQSITELQLKFTREHALGLYSQFPHGIALLGGVTTSAALF